MDKDVVRQELEKYNYEITLEKKYKITAWRFKLSDGTNIYCSNSGKIWCSGKNKTHYNAFIEHVKPLLEYNDRVFIAYGHDENAKKELEDLLRSWNLEPIAIDSLPTGGRTIIELLERYMPHVNFGIVLATPDDIGYSVGHDTEAKYRARQNVVLELGMLFSKLGRSRVAIVCKKTDNFEKPSDIDGILDHEYDTSVSEIADRLKKELNSQGYNIT